MRRIFITTFAALAASPAFAHHPLGGETPATLTDGLLSGIGHPILGLDHLAFIIAVGVAAMLVGRPLLAPLAYIATMLVGVALHVMAIDVPMAEFAIALSLLVIGVMIASGKTFSTAAWLSVFAVAGLFHGFAFGESIYGAEATPLVAYLAGLGLTQWAIAVGAGFAASALAGAANALTPARLAGAAVLGMGLMMVGETAISAAFA
jgi:urease accessory protein